MLLQARLELATPALLNVVLSYKYRALTDCATGAVRKFNEYIITQSNLAFFYFKTLIFSTSIILHDNFFSLIF